VPALLLAATGAAIGATRMPSAMAGDGSANGLIVQWKDAPPTADPAHREKVLRVLRTAGLDILSLRPVGSAALLLDFGRRLAADESTRLADTLRARPDIDWVVPNERERLLQVDDPLFAATATSSGQWWLYPVAGSDDNAPADRLRGVPGIQTAWLAEPGAAAAVVAVLDTGITPHPDLDGHVLPGRDFVSDLHVANDGNGRDDDPSDPGDWVTASEHDSDPAYRDCAEQASTWHGTVVAGIIAAVADNGRGVAGVNRDGRVVPVRVAGKCGADIADIVDGMRWAAGLPVAGAPPNPHPARILNLSLGGNGACNAAYQSAIDELARVKGAVVVAAAGNERGAPTRPANCGGVVAVAALNRDGFKATYSNFGPQLTVATVGGDPAFDGRWGPLLGDDGLLTVDNAGTRGPGDATYNRVYGTSFAAPIAAGVASLMLSANPALTAADIVLGLRITARPHVTSTKILPCSSLNVGRCICTTQTCGAGILDAAQAMRYAVDPKAYVAPAWPVVSLESGEVDIAAGIGRDVLDIETPQDSGGDGGSGGGVAGFPGLLALAAAWAALRRAR
jgi:serine protease